jgi:hypothetical protein
MVSSVTMSKMLSLCHSVERADVTATIDPTANSRHEIPWLKCHRRFPTFRLIVFQHTHQEMLFAFPVFTKNNLLNY